MKPKYVIRYESKLTGYRYTESKHHFYLTAYLYKSINILINQKLFNSGFRFWIEKTRSYRRLLNKRTGHIEPFKSKCKRCK